MLIRRIGKKLRYIYKKDIMQNSSARMIHSVHRIFVMRTHEIMISAGALVDRFRIKCFYRNFLAVADD